MENAVMSEEASALHDKLLCLLMLQYVARAES